MDEVKVLLVFDVLDHYCFLVGGFTVEGLLTNSLDLLQAVEVGLVFALLGRWYVWRVIKSKVPGNRLYCFIAI